MTKNLNRTVEEVNSLLDKISDDYSRSEISGFIDDINNRIAVLSERIAALENPETEGGETVS